MLQSGGIRSGGEKLEVQERGCPEVASEGFPQCGRLCDGVLHASSGGYLESGSTDTFLHGLSEEIKDELAAQELLTDLDSLIALTIRINDQLRDRMREKRSDCGPNRSLKDPTLHLMNSGSPRHLRP